MEFASITICGHFGISKSFYSCVKMFVGIEIRTYMKERWPGTLESLLSLCLFSIGSERTLLWILFKLY